MVGASAIASEDDLAAWIERRVGFAGTLPPK